MKFYATDLHVSIISDLEEIFSSLGHEVDFDSLSAHSALVGREKASVPGLREPHPLLGRFRRNYLQIDQDFCDLFYRRNKVRLAEYDGFIVSYPPAFALLFERFEKPIIVVSCTRFDFPVIAPERLEWLKSGLERINQKGLLAAVANNLLDAELCNKSFSFSWEHVPSLCNYMKASYEPENSNALCWFRGDSELEDSIKQVPGIDKNFSIQRTYDRDVVRKAKAVVHIPYQVSIMSAFEHYAQAIPMLVPSPNFLRTLQKTHMVLSEVLFPNSSLTLPANFIELADWYDPQNFAGIVTFNSWPELEELLAASDFSAISRTMKEHHRIRTRTVHDAWSRILEKLA